MADTQDPLAHPQPARDVLPKHRQEVGDSRTGLKVGGWILADFGSLFLVAAVALVVVHLTQRGKDGYYTSSTVQVAAPGYAITAEGLHIANLPSAISDVIGQLRVSARSNNGQHCSSGSRLRTRSTATWPGSFATKLLASMAAR
jgi:hypothetical protein